MAGKKTVAAVAPPTRDQLEFQYRFRLQIIQLLKVVGSILASAAPLYVLHLAFKEAAGKATKVDFGIQVSIVVTISLAGVAAAIAAIRSGKKVRRQAQELIRLRERCQQLEQRVKELQG
jgi:hypothetical protein